MWKGHKEAFKKSTIPLLIFTVAFHMTDYLLTSTALGTAYTGPFSAAQRHNQR